jgi:hydrogenase maturation protease
MSLMIQTVRLQDPKGLPALTGSRGIFAAGRSYRAWGRVHVRSRWPTSCYAFFRRTPVDDTLLIGIGNPDRGDDGAGLEVVRRLTALRPQGLRLATCAGNALDLLDAWRGYERVVLVDAAFGGGRPGAVRRLDAGRGRLPWYLRSASTHSWGVAEAVEMARVLGDLPAHLVVYGIEGRSFGLHRGLSPEVIVAVDEVVAHVLHELDEAHGLAHAVDARVPAGS